MNKFFFSSESVSEGHPDKIADQISDGVLDAILEKDKNARVACEVLVTTGQVVIAGEIRTKTYVSLDEVVRKIIRDIGYTDSKIGFDADGCGILSYIHEQSPDIARGVDEKEEKEQGSGDQGAIFGYATNETPEYMPMPIDFSHKILKELSRARKSGEIPYLKPDAKTQVTVEYIDYIPVRVEAVVLSTQHSEEVSLEIVQKDMVEKIIKKVIPKKMLDENTKYHINPTGRFVIGGPAGDTGLTGRKIIVDTYGGMAHHGGGAFSGKDPSKVDRSAAYAARYIAKNIVAAGLADRCEVQIAYAIGIAEPVSLYVHLFDTGKVDKEKLIEAIKEIFPLKPKDIIQKLNLLNIKYLPTAAYGHFGRDEFPWEKLDKVEALKKRFY